MAVRSSLNSEALSSQRILNEWAPQPYSYHCPPQPATRKNLGMSSVPLRVCKIRIQTSRTTENRLHVGSVHAILVSHLLAGKRGPARHPQPLPVCPLSKLSLSLLLQEATQCFSAISLMKFLKGSNHLYTSPAFSQPSPLCIQHRTELMENNDKEPVSG